MKARFINFKFAFQGIDKFFRKEVNARIHLLLAMTSVLFGAILELNNVEWILLLLTIGLVFFTEIINTIIERLSDIVQPEFDERIKEIKDMSAAGVLITSMIALAVGIFLFAQKIYVLCLR